MPAPTYNDAYYEYVANECYFISVFHRGSPIELSAHFKSGPDYRFNLLAYILIQTLPPEKTTYSRLDTRHNTNRRQAYAFQTASEICRKVRNALYLQEQQ